VRFIALLVLSTFAIGCNGLTNISTPKAHVTGVKIIDRSDTATRADITVQLINPNRTPLPLIKSHYTLNIEGAEPFSYTDRLNRTLPASGSQEITLPAVFIGKPTGNYKVDGTVTYQPPGEIRKLMTDSGIPLPFTFFDGEGKVE
jgi:hypothetical protein